MGKNYYTRYRKVDIDNKIEKILQTVSDEAENPITCIRYVVMLWQMETYGCFQNEGYRGLCG